MSKTEVLESTVWKMAKGSDRRFRGGHPWVYSNELQGSPKGILPGAPVELRDAGGQFLARGYGNPHSLIAFRALTRDESVLEPTSKEWVQTALNRAAEMRASLGLRDYSHRLCHGESDQIPGLIVDRYVLPAKRGQVFVIQAHTAGADRMLSFLPEILTGLYEDFAPTGFVIRNDLGVRKLEGLEEEEAKVLKALPGVDFSGTQVLIKAALSHENLEFDVDLLKGQKTGFFLDQASNIELAALRLAALAGSSKQIRILDLCTYVGQWGAQLARLYKKAGVQVEVLAVDASETALVLAKKNISRQGARFDSLKADVLHGLTDLPSRSFDLVISDPPALIKNRKDVPAGTHAYLQLNTQVFRLVKKSGAVVSCSCSSLLEEESFVATLSKAAYRNKLQPRWVGRGGQAADHPVLAEFPEGRYLKGWVALC